MNPLLIRAAACLLAVVALFAIGWHLGDRHRQQLDAIEHARQVEAGERIATANRAHTQQLMQEYEDALHKLRSVPPRVVHDRVVEYVRGMCPAGSYFAGVPAGASIDPAAAGSDAAVRPVDQADQLAVDIVAARTNAARLTACQGFITVNGGTKP